MSAPDSMSVLSINVKAGMDWWTKQTDQLCMGLALLKMNSELAMRTDVSMQPCVCVCVCVSVCLCVCE